MELLTKRCAEILYLLRKSKEIQTGKSIAVLLGVSTRTIRNDIKEMNLLLYEHGAKIGSKAGIGYELEVSNVILFENFYSKYIVLDKELLDRGKLSNDTNDIVDLIIGKLIMNSLSNNNINQQELADELYLSISSLKKYIPKANEEIKKFDLKIVTDRFNGIRLIGNEDKIRFCISEYIYNNSSYDFYNDLFSKDELQLIREITIAVLSKHKIRLTDVALNSLIIHIEITIMRSTNDRLTKYNQEHIKALESTKEFGIVNEIINDLKKNLNVDIYSEIYYLTQHLLSSGKLSDNHVDSVELRIISSMVKRLLLVVCEKTSIDFKDDKELKDGLIIHLDVALKRIKFKMNVRNEILNSIKNNYPLAFEMAIIACNEIRRITNLIIDENEIGFVAIHFGAALERKGLGRKNDIKKIIIVCGSGLATASLIRERISRRYGQQVNIIETTSLSDFNIKMLKEAEIVVSTVPIPDIKSDKILLINSFISNEDLSKIEKRLMSDAKHNASSIDYRKFFVKELYQKGIDLKSKCEVLDYMTSLMEDNGYIDRYTKESIYERENMASTELGGLVAIPHALDNKMNNISIAVCILKKPINWDREKVQVVIALSVPKKLQEYWEIIFRKLYDFLIEDFGVSKLITEYDYEDFIRNLTKGEGEI